MERKIGEIFECNGEWYQCVKSDGTCNGCVGKFQPYSFCNGFEECVGKIFKKLEKVGEPYEHYEKFYQCYKLPMETEIRLLPNNCYPIGKDNLVEIEIKQTKEDMEEKELNLKPFDIQKAREGKPVCTRDGRKVRIICFNRLSGSREMPVVFLLKDIDKGVEHVVTCTRDGCYYPGEAKSDLDLMMCPVKRTGYINIYDNNRVCEQIFETEEKAKIAGNSTPDKYIQTIKIEWEE